MPDKISVLIQSILKAPSDAEISKLKKELETKLNNVKINTNSKGIKILDQKEIDLYVQKMQNAISRLQIGKDKVFKNTGVQEELYKINEMLANLKNGASISTKEIGVQFDNLKTKVAQVSNEFKNVNKDGYDFITMTTLAAKKVLIWTLSTQAVFGTIRAFKEMTEILMTIEKQMTSIARVMEDVTFSMNTFRDSLIDVANQTGSAFNEAADVALRFAQAGYNVKETLELTKTALAAIQTAELDAKNATESLIGIMSQWNMQASDMSLLLDKINKISDEYTLTSQDLVDGLLRSSSAAKNLGITLDETISLLTVLRETSGRTGQEVGNALNSILSYMTRSKTLDILEQSGIQVYADEARTQFRNFMEVFRDIGKRFDKLSADIQDGFIQSAEEAGLFNEELAETLGLEKEWSDIQKRDISNAAAGTYRRNYFLGLMNSISKTTDVLLDLQEAEGYTANEMQKHMDTLYAKTTILDNAWKQLATTIGDKGGLDFLKGLTEFAIDAVTAIDKLVDTVGGLQTVLIAITGVLIALKGQAIAGTIISLQTFVSNILAATTNLSGFVSIASLATKAISALNVAMLSNPVGAIALGFTAAAIALSTYTSHLEKVQQAEEEHKREVEQTVQKIDEEIQKLTEKEKALSELSKVYNGLSSKVNLSDEEHKTLLETQNKIASISEDLIAYYDAEGNAHIKNKEAINEEIKKLKELQALKEQEKRDYYIDQLKEEQQHIQDVLQTIDDWKTSLEEIQKKKPDKEGKIFIGYEFHDQEKLIKETREGIVKWQTELENSKQKVQELVDKIKAGIPEFAKLSGITEKIVDNLAKDITSNFTNGIIGAEEYIKSYTELVKLIEENNLEQHYKDWNELTESYQQGKVATEEVTEAYKKLYDILIKIGISKANIQTFLQMPASVKHIIDVSSVLDKLIDSVSTYNDILSKVQSGQEIYIEDIIKWKETFPDIIKYISVENGQIKVQEEAIKALQKAKQDEAIAHLQAEKNKLEATKTQTLNRLQFYKIEASVLQQSAEEMERSMIASYMATAKRLGVDFNNPDLKAQFLQDKKALMDYKKVVDEIDKAIALINTGKFESSSKSSTKDSFSETFDLRLQKIVNINNAIDKLKDKLEDITNIEQKPAIYDQLIEQYKLKEKILKEVRDSYQKELDSIKFAGKEKILAGDLSNINTTDKDVAATIKRIQEIGSTLSDLDKQLYSIDNDINSLVSDKMSVSFKIFDKSLEPFQNRLEELDYQLKLLDDNDLDGQAKILQEQIKITTDVVSKYESELSDLISTTSEADKQTEWYKNRVDELTQKYKDGNLELKKYNESLQLISFKIQINPITEAIDDIEYEIDRYNEILKQSSEEKQIEILVKVNKLLEQEKNKLHELNEARRKQLSLLSPISEEYKKLQEEIEDTSLAWWRLDNQQNENIKTMGELLKKQQELIKQESADKLNIIKDVEDKIIQIIKKRYEEEAKLAEKAHQDKLKQYDERLDKFRKVINDEIALLEDQFNEEDYQRQLAEEQNKLQEIQSEINKLSLDDSLETRNKIVELTKEKAEQEKRIEELKRNHSREAQKKNLQDQLKDFEEYINDKKAKENEDYENFKIGLEQRSSDMNIYLEAQKALLEGVMYDVNGQLVSLTDAYISFENTFGEGMSILGDKIKNEFIAKILEAQSAVQNLESIMGNYMNYGGSVKNSSSNPLGMSDEDFQTYLENKRLAEQSSSPVVKQALRNKNQQLRDKYGIEEDLFDYNTLLQMTKGYSEGGLVDYTGLAMVHGTPSEPEGFLKHDDLSNLLKVLDFTDKIIHRIEMPKIPNIVNDGFSFKIDNLIAINGNVTKETVPLIQNEGNKIIERLKNEFIKRGIYR